MPESVKQHLVFHIAISILFILLVIILFILAKYYIKNKKLFSENRLIISRSKIIMLKIKEDGTITDTNNQFYSQTGTNSIKNKNIKNFLNENYIKEFEENLNKAKEKSGIISTELIFNSNWSKIDIQQMRSHNRKSVNFSLLITDIEKQVKFQTELEQMNLMLNLFEEGIAVIDGNGKIHYCNDSFLLKNQNENIRGSNIGNIVNGNIDFKTVLSKEETAEEGWESDIIIKRNEGSSFTAVLKIIPFFNKSDNIIKYICIFRDRTEEIAANNAEREHIKMEVLNNIVSGVAHEFNNYLMKITALTQILVLKKNDILVNASKIAGEARKASLVTDKLLAIAGNDPDSRIEDTELNTIIKKTISDFDSKNQGSSKTIFNLSREKLIIKCDVKLFSTVITELYKNSIEATKNNGVITFFTDKAEWNSSYHLDIKYGLKNIEYVVFQITDTGIGISPEIINKILDPYYTTKQLGRGLGLSLVYNYLNRIGGKLFINSELNKGTELIIFHPLIIQK